MTARAPDSTAFEIAIVIPRSLKEPVGLAPSNFRYRSMPGAIFFASLLARISGVLPSPSVMIGVRSVTGRNFRYSSMTPRQRFMSSLVFALDANQCHRLGHERHAVDLFEGGLNIAFPCHVCFHDDGYSLSLAPPFLQHRRDADTTAAEFTPDLSQHPWTGDDHKPQIEQEANHL